jgi:hypothetical protein
MSIQPDFLMEVGVGALSGPSDHALVAKLACERGPRLKPIFLARRSSAGLKSGFPLLKTGGCYQNPGRTRHPVQNLCRCWEARLPLVTVN